MTDQELIKAAAKAAGIEIKYQPGSRRFLYEKDLPILEGKCLAYWDPLADDGDALRLAVKLGMRDYFYVEVQKTCVQTSFLDPHEEVFYEAFKDQDPYAATRRAIVKAAAELGRLL